MLVLDAGDLFTAAKDIPVATREQVMSKAELIAKSYAYAGLDAMTIGGMDLAMGLGKLKEIIDANSLPVVAANLRNPTGELIWPAYRVVEIGDLRVGVVGAGSAGNSAMVSDAETIPDVRAAVEAVRKENVRTVILLSARGRAGTDAVLRAVEGVDLAIEAGESRTIRVPERASGVPVVGAGIKNKMLGRLALGFVDGARGFADPDSGRRAKMLEDSLVKRRPILEKQLASAKNDVEKMRIQRSLDMTDSELERIAREKEAAAKAPEGPSNYLAHGLVPLSKDLATDPVVTAWVEKTKEGLGDTLKDPHHGHSHAHGTPVGTTVFSGARACRACHQQEYTQWSGTSHARAYLSLVKDKRHMDLDCYGCHVTGHEVPGGVESPAAVGHLANVQCEACHGPGAKHVSAPSRDNIIKTPDEVKVCMGCHNEEQTMGRYVPETYWPRVLHTAAK